MKVTVSVADGKISSLTAEIEGEDQKTVFKNLANFQEVFQYPVCEAVIEGKHLKSDKVRFVVREVDDNEYYELQCVEPGPLFGYKRAFGCNKKGGGLFPKRPYEDEATKANYTIGKNGWFKYTPPKS